MMANGKYIRNLVRKYEDTEALADSRRSERTRSVRTPNTLNRLKLFEDLKNIRQTIANMSPEVMKNAIKRTRICRAIV